jgi:hypothetical protein
MARVGLPSILLAVFAGLGATAVALTTYTFPIKGAASDPELYGLIARALHDPAPPRRPALGTSAIEPDVLPAAAPGIVLAGSEDPGAFDAPAVWAASAAAADSGGLRDWLGRWVLATATTSHDTLRLTLLRWSARPGCPRLSTLIATTTGLAGKAMHLATITATCPPLQVAVVPIAH